MSLLICPLCWKANSLANYDPSDLPLDVVVRTVEGLGRGRGFRTVGEESALDEPELLSGMAERLVQLVGVFYGNDLISREDVIAKIGGESKETTEDYAEVESDEVGDLADEVWEELDVEEANPNAEPFVRLKKGVRLLIQEVQASKASDEDL